MSTSINPCQILKQNLSLSGGGGGGSDYLLDSYPAFAAFSVRQLSSDSTNCIRIREDGGGTFADIGFDENGIVDETAIATHCGANNGFVQTWYDQSGNARDAIQNTTSRQPQIYDGSAVLKQGGLPAVTRFDNTSGLQTATFTSTQEQPTTWFGVGLMTLANEFLFDSTPDGSAPIQRLNVADDGNKRRVGYSGGSNVVSTPIINR